MPIYTKTGDRGKTSLFSGKRVWKFDPRVESYGTIDELNSILGVAISHIVKPKGKTLKKILTDIQSDLFYVGAYLADLPDSIEDINLSKRTKELEKSVDKLLAKIPTPTNFVLPGGGKAASFLHQARTVARRAERTLVRLAQKEKVDERVTQYVNRLSDLLYAAARFANFIEGKKETIWQR